LVASPLGPVPGRGNLSRAAGTWRPVLAGIRGRGRKVSLRPLRAELAKKEAGDHSAGARLPEHTAEAVTKAWQLCRPAPLVAAFGQRTQGPRQTGTITSARLMPLTRFAQRVASRSRWMDGIILIEW